MVILNKYRLWVCFRKFYTRSPCSKSLIRSKRIELKSSGLRMSSYNSASSSLLSFLAFSVRRESLSTVARSMDVHGALQTLNRGWFTLGLTPVGSLPLRSRFSCLDPVVGTNVVNDLGFRAWWSAVGLNAFVVEENLISSCLSNSRRTDDKLGKLSISMIILIVWICTSIFRLPPQPNQ